LSPLYYRHRSSTALDAPERILSCLPMALMLPIEGTETLATSPFCGQLSGAGNVHLDCIFGDKQGLSKKQLKAN
jgi:hypothetical protein